LNLRGVENMYYKIRVRELISVIALFLFFLAILTFLAGLAYIIRETSPWITKIFIKIVTV